MKIFGNDGFRSRFGHNYMTIEFLSAFGFGIIDYYKSNAYDLPILIGRDTRSSHNIFVSEMLRKKSLVKSDSTVIPFGIDLSKMSMINKHDARAIMNLEKDQKICLFSFKKERFEKNYSLAEKAVNIYDNTKLMELTGQHSKEEVNIIINASDCVLLTSFREGSPQIIKEAMACGCPIVSTDVGDVKKIIGDTKGCFIVSYDPHDVADKIIKAIDFSGKTNGRQRIKMLGLDVHTIADKVKNVYKKVLNN